ncbi:hypothetical protein [Novosphingobium sp.]|uniref:hypothetical protein n=1 Tax=Novosphingobium sp. TaxID=1874826 RepID=UPI0025FBE5FD|nr:hypothetical protein [Novosphingobium sp.]
MSVAGVYDCVTKSPMGDQSSKFTVIVDGDTFTGSNAGAMGSMDVVDGKIDGNRLTWTMNMTVPMPMKLEGDVTITDGELVGGINAGAFGTMPMTGKLSA